MHGVSESPMCFKLEIHYKKNLKIERELQLQDQAEFFFKWIRLRLVKKKEGDYILTDALLEES